MSTPIVQPGWAPPGTATATSPAEQVVLDLMTALSERDAQGLASFFTDDATYQNMPLPAAEGLDAVVATLELLLSVMVIEDVATFHIASRGDLVFTERIDRLTATPTGKTFDLPVTGVCRVRDGRIAEWRDYFDLRDFEEATDFSLRG